MYFHVISQIIFIFFSIIKIKDINKLIYLYLIIFNIFLIVGHGLLDEILFFSILIFFLFNQKNIFAGLKFLKKNFHEFLKKISFLDAIFFIFFIYYFLLTIKGIWYYDKLIIRYTFLFSLLILYLILKNNLKIFYINIKNCLFITQVTIVYNIIYLLIGIGTEINFIKDIPSRWDFQGNYIAGTTIAFSIYFFTTIPALSVEKYFSKTVFIYFLTGFLNAIFLDSRLGIVYLSVIILINYFEKLKKILFLIILILCLSVCLETATYFFKYHQYKNFVNKQCSYSSTYLKNLDYKNIKRLKCRLKKYHNEPLSNDQLKAYIFRKLNTRFTSKTNYFKSIAMKIEKENNHIADQNEEESDIIIKKFKNYIPSVITQSYEAVITKNIVLNPKHSDLDRTIQLLASWNKIAKSENIYNKLFGYGFYSHKYILKDEINHLIKEKNYKINHDVFYVENPTRGTALFALITDGGIILILFYFFIYLIIFLKLINFYIKEKLNFINIKKILTQVFTLLCLIGLNFINFYMSCLFIFILLINFKEFTYITHED